MTQTPFWLESLFGLITFLTLILFLRSTKETKNVLLFSLPWLIVTALAALSGITQVTTAPPRLLFLLLIPVSAIILLFSTSRGRKFIDALDPARLTLIHVIRIPVEIVLFLLFLKGTVAEIITFEGRNYDILAGISAPLIYYFGFRKKLIGRKGLILWNILCLVLLFNVVIHAVLTVPYPFQQLAFDQPTIAVLYFPFVWLPAYVVPVVLFSHLATLRSLSRQS